MFCLPLLAADIVMQTILHKLKAIDGILFLNTSEMCPQTENVINRQGHGPFLTMFYFFFSTVLLS